MEWGIHRCGSDAACALLPPLAALLSPFNATILPVHHPEDTGPAVDFRITLSQLLPGGRAERLRFAVFSARRTNDSSSSAPVEDHTIILPVEDHASILNVDAVCCVDQPWQTAGWLVGQILTLAVQKTEELNISKPVVPR